jgi:hypothetical protein
MQKRTRMKYRKDDRKGGNAASPNMGQASRFKSQVQQAAKKRTQRKSLQPRNNQKSTPPRISIRRESTSDESPAGEPVTNNESAPLTPQR